MTEPEAIDSFSEKLATFAESLSDAERDVLAAIVVRAKQAPDAEVAGYDFTAASATFFGGVTFTQDRTVTATGGAYTKAPATVLRPHIYTATGATAKGETSITG